MMKVISVDLEGNTLFEFDNLVRDTEVVGVVAPIRILIPKEKVDQFQKDSKEYGQKGRDAAQRFTALMTSMPIGSTTVQ